MRDFSACSDVCLDCRLTNRWEASLWLNGRQLYLGGFDSEEDAAHACGPFTECFAYTIGGMPLCRDWTCDPCARSSHAPLSRSCGPAAA